jgi:hypothetical protein
MNTRMVLDLLFDGDFICAESQPEAFIMLNDEAFKKQIITALEPFDKILKTTEEEGEVSNAYYCAYKEIDNIKDIRKIKSQFEKIRSTIAPVIDFITLVIRVEGRDSSLMPGNVLKHSSLLEMISHNQTFQADLKRMVRHKLFIPSKKNPDLNERLISLLDGMVKEKLIILSNTEARIYTVTGKIIFFYKCISFICEHEEIPVDDKEDISQMELLV